MAVPGYNQTEEDKLLNISLPQLLIHCVAYLMHKNVKLPQLELVKEMCENIHIILKQDVEFCQTAQMERAQGRITCRSFPVCALSQGISV